MSIRVIEVRKGKNASPEKPGSRKELIEIAVYCTQLIVEMLKRERLPQAIIEPLKLFVYESLIHWLPDRAVKAIYFDSLTNDRSEISARTGLLFLYGRAAATAKELLEGSLQDRTDYLLSIAVGNNHVLFVVLKASGPYSGWSKIDVFPVVGKQQRLIESAFFGDVSVGMMRQSDKADDSSQASLRVRAHRRGNKEWLNPTNSHEGA